MLELSIVSAAEGFCRHTVMEVKLNFFFINGEESLGFFNVS
jgi:hypothetical protein